MEVILGLLGLVAGIAALALVLDLRTKVSRLEQARLDRQQMDADMRAAHEYTHAELGELRRDVDAAHRELAELKAAAEVVPTPPLPKARSSGLDDLRERLRAAHREPDATDEP
jgi:uncharacterized membrane protein